MSTTGILRPDEVVFYHPLDDFAEYTQSQAWTGTGSFVAGKVGSAESAVTADAPSFGSSQTIASGGDVTGSLWTQARMAAIDSTRLVACYKDGVPGKARVVTVSGSTFTMGPEHTIDATMTSAHSPSVVALTSTTVVFVWNDTNQVKIKAGVVSGTDITTGAEVIIPPAELTFYGIPAAMDATKFVITGSIYGDAGRRDQKAVVGEVSGLSVTLGTVVALREQPAAATVPSIALDSTRLAIGYINSGTTGFRICTISGLTMTIGAESTGPSGTVAKSMVKIDSSTFVFLFGQPRLRAVVGSVSGTSITLGASVDWNGSPGWSSSAMATGSPLNSTSIIAVHSRYGAPYATIGTVSGLDITFGAQTSLDTLGDVIGVGVLSGTTFFVTGPDATDTEGAVGLVDMASSMTAPTPGVYPACTGNDRVVVAMWTQNVTKG